MSDDRTVVLPPHLQAAKAATKALIRAAGGQEAAAAETGKSQPRLSAYGLPNTEDFIAIDTVAALEAVTHGQPGHPHITRWLARQAGFALVALPASTSADEFWSRHVATLLKETGDMISGIGDALQDDNAISSSEALNLLAEADDMVNAAVEIREALKRRAEGGR